MFNPLIQLFMINFENLSITKTTGANTPESEISITILNQLIDVFEQEIPVQATTEVFNLWRNNHYPADRIMGVLNAIIVGFGEGFRIWGKHSHYFADNHVDINNLLSNLCVNHNPALVDDIMQIKGIGPSYATKIARFINPDYVVLDSILCAELGLTSNDYNYFLNLCDQIKEALQGQGITRSNAQIESGIFTWVQLLKPNQRKRRWRRHQHLLH